MTRSYITEKQVGREFWYFAVRHAALMLNQVPGRLGRKLTTPFELVYNKKPDSKTWFEVFSIGYFPVESKAGEAASASQSHSMDGIAVGRDDQSNTILFYNPITKKYYSPPVFKLEQSHLPVMLYPKNIRYDGGFVCGPLRNRTDPVTEPFPPGTRVFITKDDTKLKGTIQNVPIPFSHIGTATFVTSSDPDSDTKTTYTVLLDDGTTAEVPFEALVDPIDRSIPQGTSLANVYDGLPAFFSEGSKVTIDHNGAFHKGFLHYSPEGDFKFKLNAICVPQKSILQCHSLIFANTGHLWSEIIFFSRVTPLSVPSFDQIRPTTNLLPTSSLLKISFNHVHHPFSKLYIPRILIAMFG
jgi:hypothetical protein